MQYRRLGAAGVKVSAIGLGGWLTFGNAVENERGREIIARAFDLGINFFDTANVYAAGACEEMWGGILHGWRRDSYVLATKVFFPMGQGPNDRGLSRKHIMEQCHASLRRLDTAYIDLYQCHRFDEESPLEETIRAMDDLVRQGKILYWGFSEWNAEQIRRALEICDATGWERPRSSQPQYNLLQRRIEADVVPLCHGAGIGQVVWSPLAQGLLTGKYKPGQPIPQDSRAADQRQNQFIRDKAADTSLLQRIGRLEPIAREAGCSMPQLALAWILRRPEVSSAIVGATKVSQIEDNAAAATITLRPEHLDAIDATFAT